MHECLLIKAVLSGPLSVRDPIHLDGLLLAARERRDGPEARGTEVGFVARHGAVLQASAGFMVVDDIEGPAKRIVTRVRSLNLRTADGYEVRFPEELGRDRVLHEMSPWRPALSLSTVLSGVREIRWAAVGSATEIEDLLQHVTSIGKMAATGWGAVDRWEVEERDADPKLWGLASSGRAIRQMPFETAVELGLEFDRRLPGRVEPPYAIRESLQDCVAPGMRSLLVNSSEAKQALRAA